MMNRVLVQYFIVKNQLDYVRYKFFSYYELNLVVWVLRLEKTVFFPDDIQQLDSKLITQKLEYPVINLQLLGDQLQLIWGD